MVYGLIKGRVGDALFDVRVRDIHTGCDIQDVVECSLETTVVLHGHAHGHVVDFMRQNNGTALGKSTVLAHVDEVLVVLVDGLGGNTRNSVGSPVISINVPEDSSQVQLGGDPTHTVIQVTLGLKEDKGKGQTHCVLETGFRSFSSLKLTGRQ